MKADKRLLTFILVLLIISIGCKKTNEAVSDEEIQATKLANTWIINDNSSVKRDSDDLTDKFSNFNIRFTKSKAYTVQNDPDNVIYPSGNWKFADDSYNSIYLNGEENPITIEFQDDGNVLVLDFLVSENSTIGGRIGGINGKYQFVLSKK